MKILFLHNYYQHLGGEDLSFESEVMQLRARGHQVMSLTRDNREMNLPRLHSIGMGNIGLAVRAIWSQSARDDVEQAIEEFRPDVMHCNNLFPQFSASVYGAAQRAGVPIVQALRNYRYFCSNSFLFRDGKICEDCLQNGNLLSALRHRCYRDSLLATSAVAAMQTTHRMIGTWNRVVDLFFTPSQFAREIYIRGGFDPDQIMVKPNFIDPDPGAGCGNGEYGMFVGRLSHEKGLDVVFRAWRKMPDPPPILIVGEGPMRDEVVELAKSNSKIQYLGPSSHSNILNLLGNAKFLVMPSVWYETFGRTIAESFSRGTPVLASRLGAMAELVQHGENGFLFEAKDDQDLSNQVTQIRSLDSESQKRMRQAARKSYLDRYTSEATYELLIQMYQTALIRSKGSRRETRTDFRENGRPMKSKSVAVEGPGRSEVGPDAYLKTDSESTQKTHPGSVAMKAKK
jgi:glycosyltransferase involved in cell wall biosynthesis